MKIAVLAIQNCLSKGPGLQCGAMAPVAGATVSVAGAAALVAGATAPADVATLALLRAQCFCKLVQLLLLKPFPAPT